MELREKAADFSLNGIDKNGNEIEFKLSDHFGKAVILFFYPKDDTPNCTIEAGDFSDSFAPLDELALVVGISRDDIDSHKRFREKYDLKVTLLSDPEADVHNIYGICEATDLEHKKMIRSTFLIDKEGKIDTIWKDVDVHGHVEEVLQELKKL